MQLIKREFGSVTLDPLRIWSDRRVFDWLRSLNGVGPKSAYCVMMYSLGRNVFPVDTHVRRVCARLGFIPTSMDHKKAQQVLADAFPKSIRKSLHVTMVSHGRKTCRPTNPRCGSCPLSGFCQWYRTRRKHAVAQTRPTAIDLFAGCGGASAGLVRAGYRIVLAIDNEPSALMTYYLNRPEVETKNIWCGDIRRFSGKQAERLGRVDLMFASPPCQPFSMVGKRIRRNERDRPDSRRYLYKQVIRLAAQLRPKSIVMENVAGFLTAGNGRFLADMLDGLRSQGFTVDWPVANSLGLGVPQSRPRVFLIAVRARHTGKGVATRALKGVVEVLRGGTKSSATLKDAVWDLPRLRAGSGGYVTPQAQRRGQLSAYALRMRNGWPTLFNHQARNHNQSDLELYKLLRAGETAKDAVEKYGRHDLMRYGLGSFTDKYRKLVPLKPAPTVVAHLAKDANMFIHPRDNRGLTVRKAARLQGIHDDFVFLGNLFEQFTQVGNAVPPIVAEEVSGALLPIMKG